MLRNRLARWESAGAVLAGVLALFGVLALQFAQFPPLSRAGHMVFDAFLRAEPRAYEAAPVRVIDIDEESLRRFGQWPWPRTQLAELERRLGAAGAAAIALDIVLSEPDRTSPAKIAEGLKKSGGDARAIAALAGLPDNDTALAEAMTQLPVVNGFFLTQDARRAQAMPKAGFAIAGSQPASIQTYANAILPLPALEAAATGSGSLSLGGDADGIIRRVPLVMRQGDQLLPGLSLEALRVAQGAGAIVVKTSDGSGTFSGGRMGDVVSLKVGEFEVPTTAAGELWVDYTPPRADRVIPAWKILSGMLPPAELERLLGGHLVFVGTGAIGLRDLVATPVRERELGVLVHAQAAEQMILGRFLTRPDWAIGLERALVFALGLILLLLLPRLGAVKGAALGLALAGAVTAGSWYAFHSERFLLDPVYPVLAVLAVYIIQTALTYYREERRRSYIHRAFDRYLSPELVRRIAADPRQLELGGEERQMTVLFCDIRSFSRLSENLPPKDIIRFLIGFLTPMCDVLLSRRATIDKFIGDAILAFWNAPLDDPQQYANAARAALEMVEKLDALNREMPARGDTPWPDEVRIGIGLNAGPCCVGNMGSAQRLSYSLIGDTVNLASRIEGQTKFYGVSIAIGSALRRELPQFATVPLDLIRVVGRDAPEEIGALLGDEEMARDPDFRRFAERHAAMIAAYREKNFSKALERLDETAADAKRLALGKVHALYRERIAELILDPPSADWDGVFAAAEK